MSYLCSQIKFFLSGLYLDIVDSGLVGGVVGRIGERVENSREGGRGRFAFKLDSFKLGSFKLGSK